MPQSGIMCMIMSRPVCLRDKLVDSPGNAVAHYQQEGKYQLVVAIGHTGGQHRSVAVAESLYRRLTNDKIQCVVPA